MLEFDNYLYYISFLLYSPGCSSLDGFFYEQGPFEIDTSDYTKLKQREYRWNTVANMIFLEAPVGVGFSYSDTDDYRCNDDRTATESRAALEDFFQKFPELKKNKFFLTGMCFLLSYISGLSCPYFDIILISICNFLFAGESYGGIYVPTLAEAIVQGQLDSTYTGAKLNGIAVGNGCSGSGIGICGR